MPRPSLSGTGGAVEAARATCFRRAVHEGSWRGCRIRTPGPDPRLMAGSFGFRAYTQSVLAQALGSSGGRRQQRPASNPPIAPCPDRRAARPFSAPGPVRFHRLPFGRRRSLGGLSVPVRERPRDELHDALRSYSSPARGPRQELSSRALGGGCKSFDRIGFGRGSGSFARSAGAGRHPPKTHGAGEMDEDGASGDLHR